MSLDDIQQTSHVVDVSNPLNAHPTKSWSNPRKRSHKSDQSSLFEPIGNNDHLREDNHGKRLHAPKRIRSSEWPLKNTVDITATDSGKYLDEDSAAPSQRRSSITSLRPSKFQEGSMNDKVSQRPPAIFTGDEDAMERYVRSQGGDEEQVDVTYPAGIDSSRHSGMYRFGKAIASTFNPSSIWQGINGIWKEKETKISPEKQVLQERQAKAAEAYTELKKSGYKGTQAGIVRRRSEDMPTVRPENIRGQQQSFRDSGIDVDSYRSSTDRKDSNMSSVSVDTLKVPQTRTSKSRSPSPFSGTESRKSSLHFRKPSLQSLKKAKSHLHLPSTREETTVSPPIPPLESNDTGNTILTRPRLRKEPSKKDIAKQCKLSKKVSDLENKLDVARRELELSMSTAPPVPEIPSYVGRKRFVPGALPSLPSERNMFPPGSENEDPMVPEAIQQPNESRMRGKKGIKEKAESRTVGHISETSTSHEGNTLPAANEGRVDMSGTKISHGLGEDAAENSASATASGKIENPQNTASALAPSTPAVPKHRIQVASKTPQNSPMRIAEEVPPMPDMPINVDPVKIDQAKILSMRSDRNSRALFGALPEDIHNLWKAYPDSADGELAEYIRRQPGFNKITDQSSLLHHPARSSSLSLGRPALTSPRKTRSKTHKRGISPPPPSLASAKKVRFDATESKDEERVLRKKPAGLLQAEVRKPHEEKPLPDIQKEDFDWPEDVF